MNYNSATQSWDASNTQLATAPNLTNNPSVTKDTSLATLTPVVSAQTATDQINNSIIPTVNSGTAQIATAAQLAEQKRIADAAALAAKQKTVIPPTPKPTPEENIANQGMQTVYDRATGEPKQIPDTDPIPSTYTKVDVKNPIAQDTVSSSDSQFVIKKLADGTFGKYDQGGNFLGMTDNAEYTRLKVGQAAEKAYQDALTNGPLLNDNQKAIIKGISDTYQRLLDTQAQMNANATGVAARMQNLYGMNNSVMANNEIRGEAERGAAKIADINSRMTSDIAKMTESLKADNLAQLKDAYKSYQDNSASLQKEIDNQKTRAQAMADKAQQQKETADNAITNDINTFQAEVSKAGGAEDPIAYAKAVANRDYNGMVAAAGNILTGGIGGEYNLYKKDAIANGVKPMSFDAYQTADANRKIKIAAAGTTPGASGYTPQILSKIQPIAGNFDNEQVVKDYNVISQQVDAVKGLGITPTDDIQRIYAFAKVMDPNSAVRESEYATVQAYSTALMQRAGLKANRVFSNDGFLTDEARKFLLSTLNNRLKVTEKAYKNVYDEYGRRIDKITGGKDGTDFITDYSKGFNTPSVGDAHIQSEVEQGDALIKYGSEKPENAAVVKSLQQAFPNATPAAIYKKLQEKGIIPFPKVGSDTKPATGEQDMTIEDKNQIMDYMKKGELLSPLPTPSPYNYKTYDSVVIPKTSRFATINNNPGNLKFAGQDGAIKGEGGFAKFNSIQDGMLALQKQIQIDMNRGHTLESFISKYAPPGENNTEKYIKDAMKTFAVDRTVKIKDIPREELLKFLANYESGTKIL